MRTLAQSASAEHGVSSEPRRTSSRRGDGGARPIDGGAYHGAHGAVYTFSNVVADPGATLVPRIFIRRVECRENEW